MNDMENMENREATQKLPVTGETSPAPRRRRADRYREQAGREAPAPEVIPEAAPVTDQPVLRGESETAREVARRFRLEEREGEPARSERPVPRGAASRAGMRAASQRSGRETAGAAGWEASRAPAEPRRDSVGYAPGRMGGADRGRMSQESRARLAAENRRPGENGSAASPRKDPVYGGRPVVERQEKKRGGLLTALTVALVILGVLVIGLLLIPENADGLPGMLKRRLTGTRQVEATQTPEVLVFSAEGGENTFAPTDVVFTIATGSGTAEFQIVDAGGQALPVQPAEDADASGQSIRELVWHLEEAWEGTVSLWIRTGETWTDTGRTAEIRVLALPEEEETETPPPAQTELPVVFATEVPTATPSPAPAVTEQAEEPEEAEEDAEAEGLNEEAESGSLIDEDDPERAAAAVNERPEAAAEPENGTAAADTAENGTAAAEQAADTAENDTAAELAADAAPENAGAETAGASPETDATRVEAGGEEPQAGTAEAEAAVEQRKLVVAAGENADPSLIATTQIYNGTKKVKEYARAAADQIQMPTLGEYTRQKMGILTFRTDAFRQNAAIGTVEGMNSLELAWTAEAGSAKGSSGAMYYGVGWVGQPVIVKWSKEVREQSEMYDAKKEKTGLREVIVAGLDGRIYFLDLSDGTATRNNIRLGYPMKGTPSVHPSGAPYMTVGQFARKMAKGTGTIGLRQYNLYSLKEMSLIDGLDAKNNRPFNNIGSFETSALIDRKASTLVTAGTNGMLYVIKLNPEFDYGAGVYTQSPTQVLLRSRAKGEKDASTAVEASVAMYDRYVYYADMGGFLRCVDTNSMTTAWAVALGDSVEATPALDWHGEDGLDLYVATELSLRKKGEAEIKCIDALSGEERWSTGIGVQKDTKSKTVSGFRASPVIGQEGLSDYVYFTVNNLNDAGRETLNLSDGVNAAVIALRKTDGSIVWSFGLGGRGYSSPVAVYDEAGNGAVIQCAGDGSIVMLDGLNGKEKASLEIDGAIEASPAVYNNMMVIATTEKNKNNIYGIRIQ